MAPPLRPVRPGRTDLPHGICLLRFAALTAIRLSLALGVAGVYGSTAATAEAPSAEASTGSSTTQPRFLGLGDLPGGRFESRATAVSANGSVIAGASVVDDAGREAAFRWTRETGMQRIGDLEGGARLSRATAISPDGSSIVGTSHSRAGKEAFLWQAETGMLGLGDLPNGIFSSEGSSVAAEGRFVIGTSQSILGVRTAARAFRWTREAGMVDLGLPSGARAARAFDLSDDGRTIVGQVTSEQGPLAHVWTEIRGAGESSSDEEASMFSGRSLGDLPGGRAESVATATSGDASFIVGTAHGHRGPEAFRWSRKTGLRGLGGLSGGDHESRAEDVSDDGARVVGSATSARGSSAFLWTRAQGLRPLEAVLESEGTTLPEGWQLEHAHGISRDGRTIVGSGTNPQGQREAWAVFWPPAPASH